VLKKFLYLMVAAITSLTMLSVKAENWVEITSSPDGGIKQYVDADSIERNLGLASMWRVFEYQSPYMRLVDGKAYKSQRIQTEIDCDTRAMRQVYFAWHEEAFGKGKIHHQGSSAEWEVDTFNEFTEPLWKMACE